MDKYTVEFGERAARSYARICESARERLDSNDASHPHVLLSSTLNELVEKLGSRDPFEKQRLIGPLSEVYWVSKGRLTIFFAASQKPKTVVIICISTRSMSNERRAEALIQKLILTGRVRLGSSAAAVN